jgi:hypothetical protein
MHFVSVGFSVIDDFNATAGYEWCGGSCKHQVPSTCGSLLPLVHNLTNPSAMYVSISILNIKVIQNM